MRKSSLTLLAAVIGLAASQASAADLPRKAPAYIPPPPPPLTWTGCYVGVNVGALRGRFELDGPFGGSASRNGDWGFAGGGQIGCDYQFAGTGFVIGFRNMFDGTTNHRSRDFTVTTATGTATGTVDFHNRWFDALTGRVGYSWAPPWLLYFQGGAVWSRVTADIAGTVPAPVGALALPPIAFAGSFSDTKTGWTVGLGSEYRFAPNWSVFLEGNYYDFGSRDRVVVTPAATACAAGCLFSGKTTAVSILAGVNYRVTGF
jgi:outer membrane immunogenic protein